MVNTREVVKSSMGVGTTIRGEVFEIGVERKEIARFLPIIQLAPQTPAQLFQHFHEAVAFSPVGMFVEKLGDIFQGVQILGDDLANAGSLHLDHHIPAILLAKRGEPVPTTPAASGLVSKLEKAFEMRTPNSWETMVSTSPKGKGSTLSCRRVKAWI